MITLDVPPVRGLLTDLYARAEASDAEIGPRVAAAKAKAGGHLDDETLSQLIADAYTSIAPEVGRLIYLLVRARRPALVVEFGTSFGISTIYFAAALKDNGGGMVIGSELEPTKVAKANQHLVEAGLAEFVDIRAGDARDTLKDIGEIDLLFLDGWKVMYPEVVKLLLPSLRQGAVVLADDVTLFPDDVASYLDFVRDPANGFATATLPLGDGIEYSVKL